MTLWAAKWSQTNKLDGHKEYLMLYEFGEYASIALFKTRAECRSWINHTFGYIKQRPDLRVEPHCWRLPKAVKVQVVELTGGSQETAA